MNTPFDFILTRTDFRVPAMLMALVPIVIHVITATLFCVLGAFQFSASFRIR